MVDQNQCSICKDPLTRYEREENFKLLAASKNKELGFVCEGCFLEAEFTGNGIVISGHDIQQMWRWGHKGMCTH